MRANEEQKDRHTQQKLLGRRVLVAVVDLLPQVEVIVGAGVEFKGHALHPVEHYVAAEHVGDVCEGPAGLLRDAGDDVVKDLEADDEDEVDAPGACGAEKIKICQRVFCTAEGFGVEGRAMTNLLH